MKNIKKPRLLRWNVTNDKDVAAKLKKDFKSGKISIEDISVIKRWTTKVEEEGPNSLWETAYWNDHPLDGEWKGYRSSSFSTRGRIVYRVIEDRIEVRVIRLTPDHDYKK